MNASLFKLVISFLVPFLWITIMHPHACFSTSTTKSTKFKYVKNPAHSLCASDDSNSNSNSNRSNKTIDLLIYVHSAPSNFKNRVLIRETWAKRSLFPQTRLVFMLGSTNDSDVRDQVNLESELYRDIVQQNFHDSYRNLTLKCQMALDWITKYCSHSKYVLKTDDDVIVCILFSLLFFIKYFMTLSI